MSVMLVDTQHCVAVDLVITSEAWHFRKLRAMTEMKDDSLAQPKSEWMTGSDNKVNFEWSNLNFIVIGAIV